MVQLQAQLILSQESAFFTKAVLAKYGKTVQEDECMVEFTAFRRCMVSAFRRCNVCSSDCHRVQGIRGITNIPQKHYEPQNLQNELLLSTVIVIHAFRNFNISMDFYM
jgi:hypothetical protein